MRKIYYFSKWENIEYGETKVEGFGYHSNLAKGEGDKNVKSPEKFPHDSLIWNFKKWLFFKKYIILMPKGDSQTEFRIGFWDKVNNVCRITPSNIKRKISDGPFAMRLGRDDCEFFAVGTNKLDLENVGYVKNDLELY